MLDNDPDIAVDLYTVVTNSAARGIHEDVCLHAGAQV